MVNGATENSKIEKPLITPKDFLKGQDVHISQYNLKKTLVAFKSIGDMAGKFKGKYSQSPIFSHTREKYLIDDDGTILVGQVYGGPFCSIILEELAFFGVKYAVGYGFSGTLDSNVALGSIMIAESGICSDGTSKEYTDDIEVYADADMLTTLKDIVRNHGVEPAVGKVWTTDAIYREYPSKVASWKRSGARFCNLETSPFYTVARTVGIRAVYLSVVSDNVEKSKWSGWAPDLREAVDKMYNISLEMVDSL